MNKKSGILLATCLSLGLGLFGLSACGTQKDDSNASGVSSPEISEWSFGVDLPVACEEGDSVKISPEVSGTSGYTVKYEVTIGDRSVTVASDGTFVVEEEGDYRIKVQVTANGETKEKAYTLKVIKDATAPVVTVPIADKTAEKGNYDFAADMASVVATDNKSAADALEKKVVSVTLDGQAVPVNGGSCEFQRAGEYNVSYTVADENGNEVAQSYKITVAGIYLDKKSFVSEIFQLEDYRIPTVTVYGIPDGTVKVSYSYDGNDFETAQDATVRFVSSKPVTITYTLYTGSDEEDSLSETITVKPLEFVFENDEFLCTEDDKLTIPSYSFNYTNTAIDVTIKISGQFQDEQAVRTDEEISVKKGLTEITYTAVFGDFKLERILSVVALGKDEIVSFESVGGRNTDFNVPANGNRVGNEELNSDPLYVRSGKYSAKLLFGGNRLNQNAFNAGFLYWDNQTKKGTAENANGISMWIYAEQAGSIVAGIATGSGSVDSPYSGAKISKPISLETGWNEINLNFEYQMYSRDLNARDGISELCFYHVSENADSILSGNGGQIVGDILDTSDFIIYLDCVSLKKLELPDGVYFDMDEKYSPIETINTSVTVISPYILAKPDKLTITLTRPDGSVSTVKEGETFILNMSGTFTVSYNAEKAGKPTQTETYEIMVNPEGEILSFETANGTTVDFGERIGNEEINSDAAYVKSGKQSAKLIFGTNRPNKNHAGAGFLYYEANIRPCTVTDVNGLTAWIYAEKDVFAKIAISTGRGDKYTGGKWTKPLALTAGWNFVRIDTRFDMTDKINLSDGISEFWFYLCDSAGEIDGNTDCVLYLDCVCYAVLPKIAVDYASVGSGDVEFGKISLCTDSEYSKDGYPSLKMELDREKGNTAAYSAWGKGRMFSNGENKLVFEVFASRDAIVAFEFGTGGNSGSAAYTGRNLTKPYTLKTGWNTVTVVFDQTDIWWGENPVFTQAAVTEGIVHFGATAVTSDYVLGDVPAQKADASESLTLYVGAMYAENN